MKVDGSILIDTKIIDGGMEKGFELIKDEMSSVGLTARQVGEQIDLYFSEMDLSKPLANAVSKVQQLEEQLSAITADYQFSVSEGDDRSAERLAAKRIAIYDRLEAVREKLALEIAEAVQKEAQAEEKASQRKIKAAEKEAQAKRKAAEKQLDAFTKPLSRFNSRLSSLISGALVFNLISAGLRSVTSYFGEALMANDEFAEAVSQLKGALLTAFQPIYEYVAPALLYLVKLLTAAVQAVGQFFAALTGKDYSQMQQNAEALYDQANALESVGSAAKEAKKQLMGFDQINRLESMKNAYSGGSGSGSGNAPTFDEITFPNEWETGIEAFALRVKDIAFKWDDLSEELITEKIMTGLGTVSGGLLGGAVGGIPGALVGMGIGTVAELFLTDLIFDEDGSLSANEILYSLASALDAVGGALIGFTFGGPVGGVIGATAGIALSFGVLDTSFEDLGKKTRDQMQKLCEEIKWAFNDLSTEITKSMSDAANGVIRSADSASQGVKQGFITPTRDETRNLSREISASFAEASAGIKESFAGAASGVIMSAGVAHQGIKQNLVAPTRDETLKLTENISKSFSDASVGIKESFSGAAQGIIKSTEEAARAVDDFYKNVKKKNVNFQVPLSAGSTTYSMARISTPEIPQLAKGAVLPANQPFMAIVGDQKRGTNVEAPLSTIEEAVANVLARTGGNGSDQQVVELLQSILEAVLGIELDGETLSSAVHAYDRKKAVSTGGYV